MSLINKMLKDLEARQPGADEKATVRPIFSDLQPARRSEPRRVAIPRAAILGGVAVVAIGVGAYLAWMTFKPTSTTVPVDASVAAAPAADAPIQTKAPAPNTASALSTAQKPTSVPVNPSRPRAPAKPVAPSSVETARVEKTQIPLSAEERAELAYRDAVRRIQSQRRAEAEQNLYSALQLHPRHEKARELLVGLLIQQGRHADAVVLLEEGVRLAPERSGTVQLLARLYVEHGADSRALALLENAEPSVKNDPEVSALLAAIYQRLARHPDAIAAYERAVSARPREGRWWLGLGISAEAEQQAERARDAYERARASNLDPRLTEYATQRLTALKKVGSDPSFR